MNEFTLKDGSTIEVPSIVFSERIQPLQFIVMKNPLVLTQEPVRNLARAELYQSILVMLNDVGYFKCRSEVAKLYLASVEVVLHHHADDPVSVVQFVTNNTLQYQREMIKSLEGKQG